MTNLQEHREAALDRCRDFCAGSVLRVPGTSRRDWVLGAIVYDLPRISRLRNSLLPLSGELHFPRLRRSHHVAFLETTRSARDGEWSTPLRGFDRDDFCSHRVVDSD